jgi:hypothetical protein
LLIKNIIELYLRNNQEVSHLDSMVVSSLCECIGGRHIR